MKHLFLAIIVTMASSTAVSAQDFSDLAALVIECQQDESLDQDGDGVCDADLYYDLWIQTMNEDGALALATESLMDFYPTDPNRINGQSIPHMLSDFNLETRPAFGSDPLLRADFAATVANCSIQGVDSDGDGRCDWSHYETIHARAVTAREGIGVIHLMSVIAD